MLHNSARHGEYVDVVASGSEARLADRAIETLSRLLDGYFCDPSTGMVVLYERRGRDTRGVPSQLRRTADVGRVVARKRRLADRAGGDVR
jgi:hypothetical protein